MKILNNVFTVNWTRKIATQQDYWVRAGISSAAAILAAGIPLIGTVIVSCITISTGQCT